MPWAAVGFDRRFERVGGLDRDEEWKETLEFTCATSKGTRVVFGY
jgi:hypothetical protein